MHVRAFALFSEYTYIISLQSDQLFLEMELQQASCEAENESSNDISINSIP
jgi:hypothetical protein